MKTKAGISLIIIGSVLLLAALGLFLWNQREQSLAEDAVTELMPALVEAINERQGQGEESLLPELVMTETEEGLDYELVEPPVPDMPTETINGYEYIGFVGLPSLNLELPVMSDWSYQQLYYAPCRYTGNMYADDLVVMAHNYRIHFGRISELKLNDTVTFTDMNGETVEYCVVAKDILQPQAVEEMSSGEYDLTLFTCTYGGRSRVTIRCDRVNEE